MIVKYLTPALAMLFAANLACAGSFGSEQPRPVNPYAPDTDVKWQEGKVELVDYPASFDWRELTMPPEVKQRVFIDAGSLQIGEDGAVRITMRQLSSKGADNISREGFVCKERTQRSYAFADTAGKRWIESTRGSWQKALGTDYLRRAMLDQLCDGSVTPRNNAELLNHLNKTDDTLNPRSK